MNINDLDIGYSALGAIDYVNDLNAIAITQTKDQLREINGIRTATEKGWSGQAQINFMTNLEKSEFEMELALEKVKNIFDKQFASIEENINESDNKMVELN